MLLNQAMSGAAIDPIYVASGTKSTAEYRRVDKKNCALQDSFPSGKCILCQWEFPVARIIEQSVELDE